MDIFVFGSNLAGRHGKGAALHAKQHWGAQYGVGRGLTGRAYALPTKTADLYTRPLTEIGEELRLLDEVAWKRPDDRFLLTPIGCGLAGHKAQNVAIIVMARITAPNIVLTRSWLDHLSPNQVAQMGREIV